MSKILYPTLIKSLKFNLRRNVVRPAQAILNYDQIKLYGVNNGLQKRDAKYAIDRYLPLMNFDDRRHETLLDIGSGDGGILHEFLLPKLPTCVKEVVGSDFSQLMINYAKEHAGVDFILLDIQGDDIPGDFKNYFNHVFSHYCLHWVQNQRQAFKNIYNLMAPGGDVLLVFLASNPIYDIYNTMGNTQKWMPFMPNYKKYISPYHFSSTPIQDLESILNGEGFSIHLCRLEDRNFAFPNIEALEKATKAVNPFIKSIPEDLIDEYLNDFVEEVRKLDCVKIYSCENNNESKITFTYQLFIVFASKPDKK